MIRPGTVLEIWGAPKIDSLARSFPVVFATPSNGAVDAPVTSYITNCRNFTLAVIAKSRSGPVAAFAAYSICGSVVLTGASVTFVHVLAGVVVIAEMFELPVPNEVASTRRFPVDGNCSFAGVPSQYP